MKRIDAHQHFWKFDPIEDGWITDEMQVLRRDFMPKDLLPILESNGVGGCIAVQAAQSLEETQFLIKLSNDYPFIKGVVGWVDLRSKQLEKQLDLFSYEKKLKGFRHIVQAEKDSEFLLRSSFLSGIRKLHEKGYTYDLLIRSNQLPQAIAFAKCIDEDQLVIIDHFSKPTFLENDFDTWAVGMKELASHENFYCKLSGLVTETDWNNWKNDDFEKYITHVLECFGAERVLFGSDWPVCTLAADYNQVIDLVHHYIKKLTISEQEMIWYKNAEAFYKL